MCIGICATLCTAAHGIQKVSDPLKLDSQMAVRHVMWEQETEPEFPGRTVSDTNHWTLPQAFH